MYRAPPISILRRRKLSSPGGMLQCVHRLIKDIDKLRKAPNIVRHAPPTHGSTIPHHFRVGHARPLSLAVRRRLRRNCFKNPEPFHHQNRTVNQYLRMVTAAPVFTSFSPSAAWPLCDIHEGWQPADALPSLRRSPHSSGGASRCRWRLVERSPVSPFPVPDAAH